MTRFRLKPVASFASILTLIAFACPAAGQGTKTDYLRAAALGRESRERVFKAAVEPHWFAGNDRFWYRNDLPDRRREFIVVDAVKAERGPAFDHARLAAALQRETEQPVDPQRLPFDRITIEDDGGIRFEAHGKAWRYDANADALSAAKTIAAKAPPRGIGRPSLSRSVESPDGTWSVSIREHDLFLHDRETGESWPLTTEGTADDGYESRVFWSPDSRKLVALRTAKAQEHLVQFIESSPWLTVQPRLRGHQYLKPGDRIAVTRPHLFDLDIRSEVPISTDLAPTPWSIDEIRWAPDSARFTFAYNQRGHQVLRIIAVDATSGATRTIIDETSKTFVDYANKRFVHYLDDTNEIIWMSERDGWNHLYRFDSRTGAIKNQVTKGEWVVRGVDRVDDERRQIIFSVMGIHPGEDPYHIHLARVDFDGGNLTLLTEGDGTHETVFSPDGRFLIDTYSRVDAPPVTQLRRASDGGLVCPLERADITKLVDSGWKPPERFVARGRDGTTDIFGVIHRPMNHDPSKLYPVIEKIYAGPHGAFVPKAFAPFHDAQVLAELGFVVVQIDGMGTNWRSRAFHDVCWKNLADSGFPDRIAWIKAAAAKDPSLDLARVGIYGGSAGGQSALASLLFHGDFYKAAAADCGCHDNRMDKIWWNELWMGWPVGPHYAEQSNVTNAHKLEGKLLLTVGELDHNVDPASTMQVVNALIKANKDFELVVFPGADHGAGGSPYGRRRRQDFFVRHLLGVEPRGR